MLSLGIDAGASATKWTYMDNGVIVVEGVCLPMDGHIDRETSRIRMVSVLEEIKRAIPTQPVASVYAGITGLSETSDGLKLTEQIFEGVFNKAKVTLVTDVELGYRAHLNSGEGIFLYSGTGSIAVHIDEDEEVFRAGGWGYLLGDEGSGYWIGREAIRRVLLRLEMDVESNPTSFEDLILSSIYCSDWSDVKAFVYSGERSQIAAIARDVIALGEGGHMTARDILETAAQHLTDLVFRLEKRVGKEDMPVVFAGGISLGGEVVRASLERILGRTVLLSDVRSHRRAAELGGQ